MNSPLRLTLLASVTASLLGVDSGPDAGAVGLGPLRIGSQSPGQSLHLGLIPHAPMTLPAGAWEFYAGSTLVNDWAKAPEYQVDFESLTSEAMASYAIDRDWQIEAGVESRIIFGGYLDGFIQGFHRTFGIGQDGRTEVPRGRALIRLDPTASQPRLDLGAKDLEGNRTYYGYLSVRRSLLRDDNRWPTLALSATAQAPLEESALDEGGTFDVSLDLAAGERVGSFSFYQTLAWTRFGAHSINGIIQDRTNWSGLMAFEYRWTPGFSLIFQYLLSQGVAPDARVFSDASHEVALGAKVAMGDAVILELGLIENLFIFDNSPDFGIHLGLSLRL